LTLPSGDRERIGEAVWHLLHNAIKFSNAEGQIVIRARTEGEYLAIEVKDTGVGIPLDKQAQVWESFAQLSDSVKRGVEGLGLGLSLVRYVALAHGGNVVLHSEPGVGSVIGFWLPISHRYDGAA
jgi:signal transduction histidine kinase